MFKRILDIEQTLKRKSVLLLGPRQTGKSTWLKSQFPNAYYIDLLRPGLFHEFMANPNRLGEVIELESKRHSLFIVDEIQALPFLLNEIHYWIEKNKNLRFILTGSSARKLKRAGSNMLGGRLSRYNLHPLCYKEYSSGEDRTSWEQVLQVGALPGTLTSSEPWADLQDYVDLYLKAEIQAEGLSRSIENFSRFLFTAALSQGEQLNFTQIGSDAQVPARTIIDYYQILEDTLIGSLLPAFTKTTKRKAMTKAKFYFFDIGVGHAILRRRQLDSSSPEYGKALEQLIFNELTAYRDYVDKEIEIMFWRSTSQFEVDFVIQKGKALYGIEVKAKANPGKRDFAGLKALQEEFPKLKMIVTGGKSSASRTTDGIDILPVSRFLTELWSGDLIT